MALTEEFTFQNVAYRPTGYKTGVQTIYTVMAAGYEHTYTRRAAMTN